MEMMNLQEKQEIEQALRVAGFDSTDLSESVKELHTLLLIALGKIYPEMKEKADDDPQLLDTYVSKLSAHS